MRKQQRLQLANSITNKLDALQNIVTNDKIVPKELGSLAMWSGFQDDSKPKWKPKLPQFPQVFGSDGKTMVRADEIIAQYAEDSINPIGGGLGINSFAFNQLDELLVDNWFLGYAQYSLLTQNGLLYKICSVISEEMCRKWIEFKGLDDSVKEDKIKELEIEFERLGVRQLTEWACYLTFVFGGCMMFPKLKGDEINNERETELFIDNSKIGIGDLEYIGTIEPTWYVPIKYNTIDPFSQWFYKPEFYTVIGQITHTTRLFKFIYNEPVNLIKPIYLFNGIPLLGQLIPYVRKFESTYNAIVTIIQRYNLSVLKTNQEAIISGVSQDQINASADSLRNRVQIFNTFRNNLGTFVLAKDEEFDQVQMTLTGLDKLLSQILELVAIIPGAPVTKLFGTSPQGMNSTGEFEMKNFYDRIASLQQKMIKDNLINIMHCAMLNIWGEIDDKITFEFCKLEETNPLEDSTIRLNDANRDVALVGAGIVSPEDVQIRLAADPDSGYNQIEIEEKLDENLENEEFDPEDKEKTEGIGGNNKEEF